LRRQSDHIEQAWSGETATAQAGDEGEGAAWPVRDLRDQPLMPRTAIMLSVMSTARMLMTWLDRGAGYGLRQL
jgi:hypothetical protein